MKMWTAIILTVLVVGCSPQPEAPKQTQVKAQSTDLTEVQVKKLATDFKAEWLKQNPTEVELMDPSTVLEVRAISIGWHVIFERITLPGEPEGESHHFLHVYMDSEGNLEQVVRGPDEIT